MVCVVLNLCSSVFVFWCVILFCGGLVVSHLCIFFNEIYIFLFLNKTKKENSKWFYFNLGRVRWHHQVWFKGTICWWKWWSRKIPPNSLWWCCYRKVSLEIARNPRLWDLNTKLKQTSLIYFVSLIGYLTVNKLEMKRLQWMMKRTMNFWRLSRFCLHYSFTYISMHVSYIWCL